MSDYTPTTEEVRNAYGVQRYDQAFERGYKAEFDRWLAEVKAEAVNTYIAEQEMKAHLDKLIKYNRKRNRFQSTQVKLHRRFFCKDKND